MGSVVDRYFMFVIHDAAEKWQPIWHCGWSAAALLAILLVIGNVEQNPGPPSESAFLNCSCRDGAVRDLECFTADGASQGASTVRRSGRERRPTERAAALLYGDVAASLNDDGDGARRVRRRLDVAAAFLDNAADDPEDGDGAGAVHVCASLARLARLASNADRICINVDDESEGDVAMILDDDAEGHATAEDGKLRAVLLAKLVEHVMRKLVEHVMRWHFLRRLARWCRFP